MTNGNIKQQVETAVTGEAIARALKSPPRGIETAFFADTLRDIGACPAGYKRIYFGCEFDERRIPAARGGAAAVESCAAAKKKFTLVTPLMTDYGAARLKKLLRSLKGYAPFEAVANDFGALEMIRDAGLTPVAGRLLIKQKSDPRLATLKSARLRAHFRKSAADNSEFAALLRENGIRRLELDNPLCGLTPPAGFALSLYFPFVFLTLSMRRECGGPAVDGDDVYVLKNNRMPADILLFGNAQFYENRDLKALRGGAVNRLVVRKRPY
jgi:hypothetical protein